MRLSVWIFLSFCLIDGINVFLSGCYIQYISISLLNYSHMHFWKWNKDRKMWQSDVILFALIIYSLSNRGLKGLRQTVCKRRRASSCYPSGGIHIPLTQEWMTRVDNGKAHLASSLTISVMMQAEEQSRVGLLLRPGVSNTRSGASFFLGRFVQQIWLYKVHHQCQSV